MILKAVTLAIAVYCGFLAWQVFSFKKRGSRSQLEVELFEQPEQTQDLEIRVSNRGAARVVLKDLGVRLGDGRLFSFAERTSFPNTVPPGEDMTARKSSTELRSLLTWEGYAGSLTLYPFALDAQEQLIVGSEVEFELNPVGLK